jgi:hypothetical protein
MVEIFRGILYIIVVQRNKYTRESLMSRHDSLLVRRLRELPIPAVHREAAVRELTRAERMADDAADLFRDVRHLFATVAGWFGRVAPR